MIPTKRNRPLRQHVSNAPTPNQRRGPGPALAQSRRGGLGVWALHFSTGDWGTQSESAAGHGDLAKKQGHLHQTLVDVGWLALKTLFLTRKMDWTNSWHFGEELLNFFQNWGKLQLLCRVSKISHDPNQASLSEALRWEPSDPSGRGHVRRG